MPSPVSYLPAHQQKRQPPEQKAVPGVKHLVAVASGKGGAKKMAEEAGTELLGELPLDIRIRTGSDSGQDGY